MKRLLFLILVALAVWLGWPQIHEAWLTYRLRNQSLTVEEHHQRLLHLIQRGLTPLDADISLPPLSEVNAMATIAGEHQGFNQEQRAVLARVYRTTTELYEDRQRFLQRLEAAQEREYATLDTRRGNSSRDFFVNEVIQRWDDQRNLYRTRFQRDLMQAMGPAYRQAMNDALAP